MLNAVRRSESCSDLRTTLRCRLSLIAAPSREQQFGQLKPATSRHSVRAAPWLSAIAIGIWVIRPSRLARAAAPTFARAEAAIIAAAPSRFPANRRVRNGR